MMVCSGGYTSYQYMIQRSLSNDARFMHRLWKRAYFIKIRKNGNKKYDCDMQRPGFLGAENF